MWVGERVRARTCVLPRRARVYPARPCNAVRHHFNEDVITDVSALESAMRPWRDTPSRIIGCLINHCAMHAFLCLPLCLCSSRNAWCSGRASCTRSVSTRAKSLRVILCVQMPSPAQKKGYVFVTRTSTPYNIVAYYKFTCPKSTQNEKEGRRGCAKAPCENSNFTQTLSARS